MTRINSPELNAIIHRNMNSGRYDDVEHLLREALWLVEDRDSQQRLRDELVVGFDQIAAGESIPYGPGTIEQLRQQATENAKARKPIKDAIKP